LEKLTSNKFSCVHSTFLGNAFDGTRDDERRQVRHRRRRLAPHERFDANLSTMFNVKYLDCFATDTGLSFGSTCTFFNFEAL
jgi:hypothetical protein